MSIRGIVVSPAGVNARVSALEEATTSEVRRLDRKIAAHQNSTRPILAGNAAGLAFFLLNSAAQSLMERVGL